MPNGKVIIRYTSKDVRCSELLTFFHQFPCFQTFSDIDFLLPQTLGFAPTLPLTSKLLAPPMCSGTARDTPAVLIPRPVLVDYHGRSHRPLWQGQLTLHVVLTRAIGYDKFITSQHAS